MDNGSAALADLYVAAAGGEAEAFDALTDAALFHASTDVPPREVLAAAELLARLGSINGGVTGKRKLAAVLLMRSANLAEDDADRAGNLLWQAIAVLEELALLSDRDGAVCLLHHLGLMADSGDEDAGVRLNSWVGRLSADVVGRAANFARRSIEVPVDRTLARAL
jgi:hypothetical protein